MLIHCRAFCNSPVSITSAEECLPEIPEPEVSDVKQMDAGHSQDPGGGYSHVKNGVETKPQKEEKQQYTSGLNSGTTRLYNGGPFTRVFFSSMLLLVLHFVHVVRR